MAELSRLGYQAPAGEVAVKTQGRRGGQATEADFVRLCEAFSEKKVDPLPLPTMSRSPTRSLSLPGCVAPAEKCSKSILEEMQLVRGQVYSRLGHQIVRIPWDFTARGCWK